MVFGLCLFGVHRCFPLRTSASLRLCVDERDAQRYTNSGHYYQVHPKCPHPFWQGRLADRS